MNSNPARNVRNIHDQPVNDIRNALMEPDFIFAILTTRMPHMKMNKSIAVVLGILPMNNNDIITVVVVVGCSSLVNTKGANSNVAGLKTTIDV
jgi:hypothetical protein